MASLVADLLAKHPKAFRRFYNNTKAEAYTVAVQLLFDPQKANRVLQDSYATLFETLPCTLTDEETLRDRLWCSLITRAAKELARGNAKAMRAPKGRHFRLKAPSVVARLPLLDAVLTTLPPYHRVLFVAKTTVELSDETLAPILKLDVRTLKTAKKDNRKNVEAILKAAGVRDDYVQACKEASKAISAEGITPQTDRAIDDAICAVCADAEKKRNKRRIRRWIGWGCAAALLLSIVLSLLFAFGVFAPRNEEPTRAVTEAKGLADITPTHHAAIEVNGYGTIRVALDGHLAPKTVENFVKLAEEGFYNGLTFHRIIEGSLMQGGCPMGNGTGNSSERIVGEFAANGFDNPIKHTRGAISMAREQDYDSAGSQFFIVHQDSEELDGEYAAFGYVLEGLDIVDRICADADPTDGNGTILREEQPVINRVTVTYLG